MILRWLNRSLKRLSEKRSYYSDTPGKFVLLKELKRNFLQIFFVDNLCFRKFGIPLLIPYTKDFGRITRF